MDEVQLAVVSPTDQSRSESKSSPDGVNEVVVPEQELNLSSANQLPTSEPILIDISEKTVPLLTTEDAEDFGRESTPPTLSQPVYAQVRFKTINRQLHLIIPTDRSSDDPDALTRSWSEILAQLEQRLLGTEKFWIPQTPVYLQALDRLLDVSQLQEINSALTAYSLKLTQVITRRRQTAINAVTAGFSVEQTTAPNALQSLPSKAVPSEDPLYLQMTLRAGTEIRHGGSIIIFGDVNGGAEVFAEGDILVWGKLRGLAHAGCGGNGQAMVMALSLMPTQLRIADSIAMVAPLHQSPEPEIAYISNGRVIIVPAKEFDRG